MDIEAPSPQDRILALEAEVDSLKEWLDRVYTERNAVVAALARAFPSGTARTAIPGWDEAWNGVVYIDLPTGQASWHFHDRDAGMFASLPAYAGAWDGHSTPQKYERLAALASGRSPVDDVRRFMVASGQTVTGHSPAQAVLYDGLIDEEGRELQEARAAGDEPEELDAFMDLIWVLLGHCFSRGWPVQEAWDAVARTNLAKIDPITGLVRRREDGKIMKPEGWTPPDIAGLLAKARQAE